MVTNGWGPIQLDKIRATGLYRLLDGWAISGHAKVAKPGIRLFEIAAERCGTTVAEGGWMIGNDPVKGREACPPGCVHGRDPFGCAHRYPLPRLHTWSLMLSRHKSN